MKTLAVVFEVVANVSKYKIYRNSMATSVEVRFARGVILIIPLFFYWEMHRTLTKTSLDCNTI